MKTFVANAVVDLRVSFEDDGEPFIPAANVTYELRGQGGAVVANGNAAVGNATAHTFSLAANLNTLGVDSRFEKRTLVVSALNGDEPWTQSFPYRLTPWLNTYATPDLVRAVVGLDSGEFPDTLIDIPGAYFEAEAKAGREALEEALAAGTSSEAAANDLIIAIAALRALPALRHRIAQKEVNGTLEVTRAKLDFELLAADLGARVAAALETLSGTEVAPTLILLTEPTDIVTGA
jgi:hypothetical protein